MIDNQSEIRFWADHHQQWSRFATTLWCSLAEAFRTLTAIQFEAPWKAEGADRPCR